jgi:glycosyltransferase involved in cell wall biosynthesis
MNIAYFHRTRATGVEAVHIGQIVLGMEKHGHAVHMVSPVGEFIEHVRGTPKPAASAPTGAKAKSRELPELVFELLELGYNLKAFWDGWRLSSRVKLGGIYERYAIFALAGLLVARLRGVPLVLEVNYTSLSPLVRKRSALLKPLARFCDGLLFRRATRLMAVSSYLRDELVREFGVPADRIEVVPNAADPAVFDPVAALARPAKTPLPEGPDAALVGFVGGFYPWHGLGLLVDAFLAVAPKFPQARLLLIGDGPMRQNIEARIAELGLQDRVLMPGRIAHAELAPYVARFAVGVMPDSNLYGSPMKIFEYMAMGVPVLGPDYGPLLDAVDDGVEGYIFRRQDTAHLADCLSRLLADPDGRARMGVAARRKIIDTHNWMNNARLALAAMSPGA